MGHLAGKSVGESAQRMLAATKVTETAYSEIIADGITLRVKSYGGRLLTFINGPELEIQGPWAEFLKARGQSPNAF